MNGAINNGGPAFPAAPGHPDTVGVEFDRGMTLRDYFAGQALQGWFASYSETSQHPVAADSASLVAAQSYAMADAMLAARGAA